MMRRNSVVVFVASAILGFALSCLFSPQGSRRTNKQHCSVIEGSTVGDYYPEFGYDPLGPEFTNAPWWSHFDSKRTLYVAPYTQLGNTLQSIASAMTIAYKQRMNVKFVLNPEWFGPARSDKLFSFPVLNASQTFPDGNQRIYDTESCASMNTLSQWNVDEVEFQYSPESEEEVGCAMSCCWRQPSWPTQELWFYKLLRPTPSLRRIIEEFKRVNDWSSYQWVGPCHHGNGSACGYRWVRTDNIMTMQRLMKFHRIENLRRRINLTNEDSLLPLKNYVHLMDKLKAQWSHRNQDSDRIKPLRFYVASDRDALKQRIKELFSEPAFIVTFDWSKMAAAASEGDEKIWSRQFAVVELFLLGSCHVIIDTPFSTYSEAASYIGDSLLLEPDFEYGVQ